MDKPARNTTAGSGQRHTRRDFLGATALLSTAALGGGCAARQAPSLVLDQPPRRFARLKVSRELVIRTIAGLRPHRDSGFVVRADKFDGKVIVHNYGHSGGGISLSWGSAHLAADLALETGATEFAVLGAGCMGLCTARLLQDRGASVTIYTKDLPPNTTSNVAGGQWSPLAAFSPSAPAEYRAQYETAARFANKYFQELNLPRYGIRWIPNYFLSERPFPNYETWAETNPIADLYKDYRLLDPREHPFPVPHVQCFTTMLIEPPIFLSEVMRDLRLAGGKVAVREFTDVKQVLALPQRTVVNCTGLGAKALFGDEELMPIKGQLSFLVPQPEVDYITIGAGNLYMFPRNDGVLLGGTYKRGDWSLEPDPAETDRIIEGHRRLHAAMR